MAKTPSSLEAYLSERKGRKKLSYEEYLLTKKTADPAAFEEETRDALTRAATDLPTHGRSAEALAEAGLSSSGYADYLGTRVKNSRDAALSAIGKEYENAKLADLAAYEKYEADFEKESARATSKVAAAIGKDKILDETVATRYALACGLSPEEAEAAVAEGVRTARTALSKEVFRVAVSNKLERAQIYAYALSLGFSSPEAEDISWDAYLEYARYHRVTPYNSNEEERNIRS